MAVQDQTGKGVNVVSIASGKLIGHFTDPNGAGLMGWNYTGNNSLGTAISLDENGRVVTVGDEQGNLYVWDVAAGKRMASLRFDVASAIKNLTPAAILSPDGTRVVLPYAPNGLPSTLWDVSTTANITPRNSMWPTTWDNGAARVFFSPDSPNIVTYRNGGTAADVWDSALEHIGTVSFPSSYTSDEVFAASPNSLLADDGSHHIFPWPIPDLPVRQPPCARTAPGSPEWRRAARMVTMAEMRLAHTADLDAAVLAAARALLYDVFDDMTDHDWEHALGGMHALVWEGADLIGHASVVQRRLVHGGRALRAGYVEGVGVRADRRGRGHGAAMMDALEAVVRGAYELGALGAADTAASFYADRGWMLWRGPSSALTPAGIRRTREDDGYVYVLPVGVPLDPLGELTCDWRDGDLW